MFSPYFRVPGHTFSINHVTSFGDLEESAGNWMYPVVTTGGFLYLAHFSCHKEAEESRNRLKEALGVFDCDFSFEELV